MKRIFRGSGQPRRHGAGLAAMGLLVSGLFLAQTVGAATLQVVNDSGRSADEVYLLLSGQDLSATATQWQALKTPLHLVDLDGTPPATTCAQPLSSWPKQGTTTSPRTSRKLDVYEVPIADKITSGRLWVAYGPANAVTGGTCDGFLKFSGSAAPKNTASYRYDKMEMTYDGSQWYANLTSLDFLAIPMQLETVDGSGTVTDQRSFQTSLTSLRQRVTDLFGSAAIAGAGSDFLRIYGPGTLTTDVNADTGSPAPYPSFATYLASLVGATNLKTRGTQSFDAIQTTWQDDNGKVHTLSIPGYTADYQFGMKVEPSGNDYKLVLHGKMTPTEGQMPDYITKGHSNHRYTITVPLTGKYLNRNLYATPLDAGTFSVDVQFDYPGNCQSDGCQDSLYAARMGNTVFGWVVANVTSGLTLGLFQAGADQNQTANWYRTLPERQPFGAAHGLGRGYYNPYAALIFNHSDAYGFPFSDRITVGTNPLINNSAPTLRVTLLDENMLDAPRVTAGAGGQDGTLEVSWDAVPCHFEGCRQLGYALDIWPKTAVDDKVRQALAKGATSAALTGLEAGVVYTLEVTATAQDGGGNSWRSPVIPVKARTGGQFTATGDYNLTLASSWILPTGWTLEIAGQSGSRVQLSGQAGENHYPVILKNDRGERVFQDSYSVSLADPKDSDDKSVSYHLTAQPVLGKNNRGNALPLSPAAAGLGPGDAFPWAVQSDSLVIGTPNPPFVDKQRVAVQ